MTPQGPVFPDSSKTKSVLQDVARYLRWKSAPATTDSYAQIRVQGYNTGWVRITFEAVPYLPHWPEIVDVVTVAVFADQPVCFVGYEPPYLDADFSELSEHRTLLVIDDQQYALAFARCATPTQLLAATHTQDFKLKQLYLAAIPENPRTRAQAFVAALAHSAAVLDQAFARPLSADERVAAYDQADAELLRATSEEFMRCENDGEVLLWAHPSEGTYQRGIAALRSMAEQQGWQFYLDLSPKE